MDILKVGQYIKQRIKEKGITQDQLGEMMNVTSSAVSQVLSGKNMFDVANLQVLSRILDEPIDQILNAGEEPATSLELLATKSAEEYKKDDPNLQRSSQKDHKGLSLFDYIIKHKNIDLIRLYGQRIISELSNDIRLETILIMNEEVKMLEQLYQDPHFRRKMRFGQPISEFSTRSKNQILENNQKIKNEPSIEEIEYLKVLTANTNSKIFEITGALNVNENNPNCFSILVGYAIMFDQVNILKLDHEQSIRNNINQIGMNSVINNKFSIWLKKSIEHKSVKCIQYCFDMLNEFILEQFFNNLIQTKDKVFIQNFISKYKNKTQKNDSINNENGKFNNFDSLKQLIESQNLDILEYAIEFSTQQALDEALFITKGDQLEIIKMLVGKGARFKVNDSYSSNQIVLEPLTSMVKFLFDEISKKNK